MAKRLPFSCCPMLSPLFQVYRQPINKRGPGRAQQIRELMLPLIETVTTEVVSQQAQLLQDGPDAVPHCFVKCMLTGGAAPGGGGRAATSPAACPVAPAPATDAVACAAAPAPAPASAACSAGSAPSPCAAGPAQTTASSPSPAPAATSSAGPPPSADDTAGSGDGSLAAAGLSVEEIVGNVFSFLIAGFETSSGTMGICAIELACYPELQALCPVAPRP